ncbi:DUF6591 domain-containing protein [Huintestinicola sp.]|uniref:DUF6591 domain-containing protein n=1 Tax=Huintestinicola sp. TaxID=2981661 RepID=UPI003D7CAEA6
MKKTVTALCLSITMLFGLTGCSGNEGSVFDSTFSAKDAIKIEDIDWNVTESILDGDRIVSFNYTNNSKYTILDVEMKFRQKADITPEQLSVFDELKEKRDWTDEEIADIYILGYNRKCADPGETVSDSPCCINGTYTYVENIAQYEIMEPDMVSIAFVGKNGKGYTLYYDFSSQTYSEASQGGSDLHQWSDNELCRLLPKLEAPAVTVRSDREDYFSFSAYGVSNEDYAAYAEAVKEKGFTDISFERSTQLRATNADGIEVRISYNSIDEQLNCQIE